MFIDNFGLAWSHPIRKKWRNNFNPGRIPLDPAVQNLMRGLIIPSLVITVLLTMGIIPGDEYIRKHQPPSFFWFICYAVSLASFLSTLGLGLMWNTFEFEMKNLCAALQMDTKELRLITWSELRDRAWKHLLRLGVILLEEESKHPDDPYHNDRLKAKREFEWMYDFFLNRLSLIDPVGYGPFLRKKAVSV